MHLNIAEDQTDNPDEWVRKAVTGDSVALSLLLVAVQPRLRRRAIRRLPIDVSRYLDPQDVVQESMVAAFRGITTLRTSTFAGFVAWMNTIVDNCIAMGRRRYQARKRGGNSEDEVADVADVHRLMEFLCRNTDSPRTIAGNHEFIGLIRSAMQDLASNHRTVIRLRFIEGLDRKMTAERMGCTEGSVRMLTLRALRHLRSLLPMRSSLSASAS